MAKQRFVVYKALDARGVVLRHLLVVGGKGMPFAGAPRASTHLSRTSTEIMRSYSRSLFSPSGWADFARRDGASSIQKVIYFN